RLRRKSSPTGRGLSWPRRGRLGPGTRQVQAHAGYLRGEHLHQGGASGRGDVLAAILIDSGQRLVLLAAEIPSGASSGRSGTRRAAPQAALRATASGPCPAAGVVRPGSPAAMPVTWVVPGRMVRGLVVRSGHFLRLGLVEYPAGVCGRSEQGDLN